MVDEQRRLTSGSAPVLVLGAGINGAAVARELVLNGVPVVVVDSHDIACGATARSSRLIHGGLRYLEHGDFGLVAESLRERAILLRTAPQFVRPLRLRIPVRRRWGGFVWSVLSFFQGQRSWLGRFWLRQFPKSRERGLWLIRLGLWMYDRLAESAGDKHEPRCAEPALAGPAHGTLLAENYRWVCEYSDAQITYPERFSIALLEDARRLAVQQGVRFEVLTHTLAERSGRQVCLHQRQGASISLEPAVLINATGAWGDSTLAELRVPSPRLFGGTKGSHFLTANRELRRTLSNAGLYAEAADGRLVFILPLGDELTLIGTTDEPFEQRPDAAVAESREIDYLIELVNGVLPSVRLSGDDVLLSYSGVRPLPFGGHQPTSAIPRGHWIDENSRGPVPVLTLIGGKLTTCRALAEEVANRVLTQLGRRRIAESRERSLPGADNFPANAEALSSRLTELSQRLSLSLPQVTAMWRLMGNRLEEIRGQQSAGMWDHPTDLESVVGTDLPRGFVKWVIRHEWVGSLSDLVERRLMLIYQPRLTASCLLELAGLLCDAGVIPRERREDDIQTLTQRLRQVYSLAVAVED